MDKIHLLLLEKNIALPLLGIPPMPMHTEQKKGLLYAFDAVRRRMVRLTPEEYVRQQFVSYMIHCLGYPLHAFAHETKLPQSLRAGRTDSLVYGLGGKALLLLEFKAARVRLSPKTWQQLLDYNEYYYAPYLCLTNGVQQLVCKIGESPEFLPVLPCYQELEGML